jgi:asparagine synthase (glutamine-hydrolysing)
MESGDGRFVIVFNGEVYNFISLRQELRNEGQTFRTQSDTEVILEAYRRWGRRCLERLAGMFAFALYDTQERRLLLARDRTGIKPLYYHNGPRGFLFGSELKAILAVSNVPRRINYRALTDFLRVGYSIVPTTCFVGIHEVEPGTWLEVSPSGVKGGRFWEWTRTPAASTRENALEGCEQALTESLKAQLISDVPIGAFLSGGIDSSLLVALLARNLDVRLDTFHVRFTDAQYDESPYARAVALHLGTRHHELLVAPTQRSDTALELINCVLQQFDQPFGDSSAIPTYLVCREIRKYVKVALSGDGGDEMFGGYPRFWHADLARWLGTMPPMFIRAFARTATVARRFAPDRFREAQRLLGAAYPASGDRLLNLCSYVTRSELPMILQPSVRQHIGDYEPTFSLNGHGSGPSGVDLIDSTVRFTLPSDYLRKVDVMSGAHGLEVRVPFLGEAVLECAARLPNSLKYRGPSNKLLLRQLAARYLPKAVAQKKKWGFGIPLDSWLGRSGRRAIGEMLVARSARIRALIQPEYIRRLLDGFVCQRWDHSQWSRFGLYQRVYSLWSLEQWLARWNPTL